LKNKIRNARRAGVRVSSDGLNGNAFAVAKSKASKVGDGKNGRGDKSSDHLGFRGCVKRAAGGKWVLNAAINSAELK
jgi:hypothetical protein